MPQKADFAPQEPLPTRRRLLYLLLLLALVRGVLYIGIFPPWQHYDEPAHLEYIRLIADRCQLPKPGDYDLQVRRELAASMKAAGFWKGMGEPSPDLWSQKPPGIGVSELGHPPLYYLLLTPPQLLVGHQDVETQLYVARLTSLLFYLLIVGTAYGLLTEMFPRRRWLPLAVATFIALLPPFTDSMSSVNNDVGAAAAVSLLLWVAIRLVRRGPSWGRVGAMLLLAVACVATKSTASVLSLVIVAATGMSFALHPLRRWGWILLALLAPIAVLATFTWGGHAAHWDSLTQPASANRIRTQTPLGGAALALSAASEPYPSTVFQELDWTTAHNLQGHTVTLGVWVRAAEAPAAPLTLSLRESRGVAHGTQIEATTDWTFQAFTATIDSEAPGLAAYLSLPRSEEEAQTAYVDGIVLVDGEMPLSEAPDYGTAQAAQGRWGAEPFENLLRNASAEETWPGMRSWIGNVRIYREPLALAFHSALDWRRSSWVYVPEFSNLFHSFWGTFGWNHLSVPSTYFYPLGLLTVLGLVGSGIHLVRRSRSRQRAEAWQGVAWFVLLLAWLVGWGGAILRIHPMFITRYVVWPAARYASVAIVPTATLLCVGLSEIIPRRWQRPAAWLGLLGLLLLDAIALLTVVLPYYYG